MKYRILVIILLLLPIMFIANQSSMAAPQADDTGIQVFVYEDGNRPPELEALLDPRAGTQSHTAVQGTMWQPQFRGHFKWSVKGWGSETQAGNAYGNTFQWVHLAIPYPTMIQGVYQNILYVEFCATADHPTQTKPTKLDIWGGGNRIYSGSISWPNTTAETCFGIFKSPSVWQNDLSLSVLIKYANTTDMVTIHRAWAAFED